MKRYIYLLLALWICGSCSNFLEETPKGRLIPETVDDFGKMLEGYDYNYIGYGQLLTMMMSDDAKITDEKLPDYKLWGVNAYTWADYVYSLSENDAAYNNFYRAIYICNYVLGNLTGAQAGGEFTKEWVEGSARFHRAYAYLNLVNMYAKHYDKETASTDLGVALLLECDLDNSYSRATVAEVYKAVEEDLLAARTLLKDELPEYPFRASKAAACALLARMYLYQERWQECRDMAREAREMIDEPVDYNDYEIYGNPDDGIYHINGYDEWAYYLYDQPDIICWKGGMYISIDGNDETYNLSDDLVALFKEKEESDLRWRLFITDYAGWGDVPGEDEPRIVQYSFPFNKGLNIGEVYITEAEACVRMTTPDIDGALEALDGLASKRYDQALYEKVTERDPEQLLRIILDERRKEQLFKGTRWFDLKRLNKDPRFAKTITRELSGKTYTLAPDDNHYVIAIPLNVTSVNANMVQNPR